MPKLPNLLKLIIGKIGRKKLLFLVFLVAIFLASPARAAVTLQEFEQAISTNQINLETSYLEGEGSLFGSTIVYIVGCSPGTSCPDATQVGAVQTVGNMIASLYEVPPASGVTYMAYLLDNIGFAEPAYAQTGTGFQALQPILPLWRAFRNLTYLLFVLIFVVVGFMIMLRVPLSPQTVITIQSALPRLVMALILITFSYAIAGFLIDLLYVVLFLVIQLLGASGVGINAQVIQEEYLSGMSKLVTAIFGTGWQAIRELAEALFMATSEGVADLLKRGFASDIAGRIVGTIVGLTGGVLAALIIAIAILYAFVRIFFTLLVSYISIIFLVIFSPLLILISALPMRVPYGAGYWFKSLLANIMVFPVTAILLILGTAITTQADKAGGIWTPPLVPALAGDAVLALLGLGIILFIAQAITAMKEALVATTFARGIEGGTAAVGGALHAGAENVAIGPLEGVSRRTAGTRWGRALGRASQGLRYTSQSMRPRR